jgi:hypothetical protein
MPGSKPGERRGGRQKGTKNVATVKRNEAVAAIKASGKDPLTFFMDVLGSPDAPFDVRFAAAREAAPYMHPKLASIEARSGGQTHEDRLAEYQRLLDDEGSPNALAAGEEDDWMQANVPEIGEVAPQTMLDTKF